LTIHFAGGGKLEKHIQHAVGSLEVPMTDEQLSEKFIDQSALVLGKEGAQKASEAAWKIAETTNVAEILRTL
jgi:aconitate decarboxylase